MSTLVTNGASSHRGIYLAGSNGSASLASYAYRADGRIACETGSPEEIKALYREHRMADSVEKDGDLFEVAPPTLEELEVATVAYNALRLALEQEDSANAEKSQ